MRQRLLRGAKDHFGRAQWLLRRVAGIKPFGWSVIKPPGVGFIAQFVSLCFVFVCLAARAEDDAHWKRLDHEGMKALEKGDVASAKAAFYNAVILADSFGPKDPRYSQSYRALGFSALQLQDYRTADFGYTRALRGDETRLGSNDMVVASDLLGLVEAARQFEEFDRCHERLDRAAKIIEAKQGRSTPAMGLCYAARGAVELQEEHLLMAETNLEQAVRLLDKTAWVFHTIGAEEQLAESYFQRPQVPILEAFTNYAVCLRAQKRYVEAERPLVKAVMISALCYGKFSPATIPPLYNLARDYLDAGDLDHAETTAWRADGLARHLGPNNPMAQATRALRAEILDAEGKPDQAAKLRKP